MIWDENQLFRYRAQTATFRPTFSYNLTYFAPTAGSLLPPLFAKSSLFCPIRQENQQRERAAGLFLAALFLLTRA